MKRKGLAARLPLAACLISLLSLLSIPVAAFVRPTPQDAVGGNAKTPRDAAKKIRRNHPQVNARGGNANHAPNSNDADVVDTNQNVDQQQKAYREQLQTRAETALHSAEDAAGASEDPEVKKKLRDLSKKVNAFERALNKPGNTDDAQLNAQSLEIEKLSEEIEAESDRSSWSDRLTYGNVVSTLSLLLALAALGATGFLFFNFRTRLDQQDVAQVRSRESIRRLKQVLLRTKKYAEGVGANLSRVQEDFGLKIESAKRNSEEAKKMARSLEEVPASVEPLRVEQQSPEPVDPEPRFPALVADYLNRIKGSRKRGVEADFRTNTLVPATDGSAPFMFVEDTDRQGTGIVLPKSRLQRSQEFASYYKGYYYCNEPSAGEVYVVEPAVVERAGNGWRLLHMGRMEIR